MGRSGFETQDRKKFQFILGMIYFPLKIWSGLEQIWSLEDLHRNHLKETTVIMIILFATNFNLQFRLRQTKASMSNFYKNLSNLKLIAL